MNHELLIAKLHPYGFSTDAREVLLSLQDRWQRVKINTTFSSWTQLLQGVPQGSVLGPYCFIFTSMIYFFALKGVDLCNFAEDTTPYVCDSNLKTVLETLERNSELAIAWFETNYMKLHTNKCHLLISGNKNEQMWAKSNSKNICSKANKK